MEGGSFEDGVSQPCLLLLLFLFGDVFWRGLFPRENGERVLLLFLTSCLRG